MLKDQSVTLSEEAITYQKQSLFFKELVIAIGAIKESKDISSNMLRETGIDAIVKRHTGLNTETAIDLSLGGQFNACAHPPIIDTNGPFWNYLKDLGWAGLLSGERLSEKQLRSICENLRGMVDRKKGRVGGIFSKIPLKMFLGAQLVKEMSAEETAAVYLHEIGHLFTFVEILTSTVSTNLAISAASEALSKTKTAEERLEIIHIYERASNTRVTNDKSLAGAPMPADGYQAILIRETIEDATRSGSNSFIYDLRSSEFAADHFASMHGAGRYLVTALEAINRKFGINSRRSTATWVFIESLKVSALVMSTVAAVLMPAIAHLWVFPLSVAVNLVIDKAEHNLYDEPAARIERVKNNLIQALKDLSLDATERKKLLEDIDFINKLKQDMVDRRTLYNLVWISLTPGRRKQYNQIQFQKELESAINNNLFVTVNKLNQLAQPQGA